MNKYPTFDSWFLEGVGKQTRADQCYQDHESMQHMSPLGNLRSWLERAFYAGRVQSRYTLTVEGDDEDNAYITFPEEVLKAQGWDEGKVLSWHDNGDGTWTIKGKL